MVYECDNCSKALPPGVLACPNCGEKFDDPVPADASAPNLAVPKVSATPPVSAPTAPEIQPIANISGLDAVLRNRTAGGPVYPAFSVQGINSARPSSRSKVPGWVWVSLGVVVFLILCLGLAGWAGYRAWMRGAGGEIAYREHNQAGNLAYGARDYSRAADEYSQMIALRPRRMAGYMLRGMADGSRGHYREAIADDTMGLSLPQGRNVGDLYSNRAVAEIQSGLYPAAIQDLTTSQVLYKQIHHADSSDQIFGFLRDNYEYRAEAYASLHQWAKAEADYDTVIRNYAPASADFDRRGEARAAQGKNALALADFEQVIRLDPDNPDSYSAETDFLEKSHQYPQALATWQRARRIMSAGSPYDGRWWGTLGWFQFEAGELAQAVQSDQQALVAERAQPWVRYNLGLCYAVQGNEGGASAAYALALVHSSEADRQAGLNDIADALAQHPHSAALKQVQQQLSQSQARKTAFPPLVRSPLAVRSLIGGGAAETSSPGTSYTGTSVPGPAGQVLLGDYAITPPPGYTLQQTPIDDPSGQGTIWLWSGAPRGDGTVPTLEVIIGQRRGGSISDENTSQWLVQTALGVERLRHTNFAPSPLEQISLGGMPFTHVSWKGTGQRTGKQFEGSVYASLTGSYMIRLAGHDAVPYSRQTMPLLEKSILTFRRQ